MAKDNSSEVKNSSSNYGWIVSVLTLSLVFAIPRIQNYYQTQNVVNRLTSSICDYKNRGYSDKESIRLGTTPFFDELNETKMKSTSKASFIKSMEDRLSLCSIKLK